MVLSKLLLLVVFLLTTGDMNTNIQFKARRDIMSYATEVSSGYKQTKKHPNEGYKVFKENINIKPAKDLSSISINIKAGSKVTLTEIGDWDFIVSTSIPVEIILSSQSVVLEVQEMKFKYLRKTRELVIYHLTLRES